MSSLHRELSKALVRTARSNKGAVEWYRVQKNPNMVQKFWNDEIYPIWFRYVQGPFQRWEYERMVSWFRGYGLMFDDKLNDKDALVERALELIPKELETARYRRTMRAAEMNMKKTHLPIEEQNYDPMIPYMAPYMEEAKFQLQEEQELLMYHPYDRRMYTGGVSGLGETMPYGGVTTW